VTLPALAVLFLVQVPAAGQATADPGSEWPLPAAFSASSAMETKHLLAPERELALTRAPNAGRGWMLGGAVGGLLFGGAGGFAVGQTAQGGQLGPLGLTVGALVLGLGGALLGQLAESGNKIAQGIILASGLVTALAVVAMVVAVVAAPFVLANSFRNGPGGTLFPSF
jgi:hypothetical protein